MRVINLTNVARAIVLGTQDIILKPKSQSPEFYLTERIFMNLIQSPDYQNRYRFVMDASERSMMANHKVIPGVIISVAEAEVILRNMEINKMPARIDIFGNPEVSVITKDPDPVPEESEEHEVETEENPESEESKEIVRVAPELTWDKLTKGVDLDKVNESTKFRELINPNNLPVTYSSTNDPVASINEEGKISVHSKGKADIIATFAGNDEFLPAETMFELIVK